MIFRISHIASFLILASTIIIGCKGSTTDSNGNNPPPVNIGDTIPGLHSSYSFIKSQLDQSNNIIIGNTSPGHFAIIDTTGISIFGKSGVYFILNDGDTNYYAYESNQDVSMYLYNYGYAKNFRDGERVDGPLQSILDIVFHRWITLPIASKNTLTAYSATQTVDINGKFSAVILATTEFIGDSTIIIRNGTADESLAAKHCRINISAKITFGVEEKTFLHTRDIWFMPRIGFIGRLLTRTSVPDYSIQLVTMDTTATLTALQSYILK